jgi:D-beta-D-heptose 7-phosphate kinase/D-beta-D-heptose 1-phosphate adenosyltransferase
MVKRVWVNGSFDVLHIGHINLLEYANSLGNVRVGLDTDERIKEKKGENRPYNILKDRIKFLSSIKFVDSIVTFSSDDELIDRIKEYIDSEICQKCEEMSDRLKKCEEIIKNYTENEGE